MSAQLSTLSGTPSTSASSFWVEQLADGLWLTAVWQCGPGTAWVAGHWESVTQTVVGELAQMWMTVLPTQSPSQASPRRSRSEFFWFALGVRTQLSLKSVLPSPSRSCVVLEQAAP